MWGVSKTLQEEALAVFEWGNWKKGGGGGIHIKKTRTDSITCFSSVLYVNLWRRFRKVYLCMDIWRMKINSKPFIASRFGIITCSLSFTNNSILKSVCE